MPYTNQTAPDWVKKLPQKAKDAWVKAFNAALSEYKNESKAFAVANSMLGKMGYKKSGEKWIKESSENIEKIDIFAEMKKLQESSAPVGSFEDLRNRIRILLDQQTWFIENGNPANNEIKPYYYIAYTFLDKVIFEYNEKKYVINYGFNESGEIVFIGTPKEVEEIFVMKECEIKESHIEIIESVKEINNLSISNFISLKEANYNEKEGIFDNVILIEAGTNMEKKRHYPNKTVKESAPYFSGLKMYLNHPTATESKELPERDITKWASTIVESKYDNGKAIAKIAVHDSWLRERLSDSVARSQLGLSILAGGKVSIGKIDGETVEIVEAIVFKRPSGPVSVDWVTEAGARGRVMPIKESNTKEESVNMDLKELKEKHPELVQEILKESSAVNILEKTQQELKETNIELANFKRKELILNQINLVESILKDKKIPDLAKARIRDSFSKEIIEKESELRESLEKAIKVELDYINSLTKNGVITHGSDSTQKALKESIAEQLSKDLGLVEIKESGKK